MTDVSSRASRFLWQLCKNCEGQMDESNLEIVVQPELVERGFDVVVAHDGSEGFAAIFLHGWCGDEASISTIIFPVVT